MAQMRGSQISSLIESLPGIANVLRSPVADALVGMIRAGARLGDFREEDAKELVQYAVRRGLLGADEGGELLDQVKGAGAKKRAAKAKRVAKAVAGESKRKTTAGPSKKSSAKKAPKKKVGAKKKATAQKSKSTKTPAKSAKKVGKAKRAR
jgi:hypothetical protein